MSKIDKVKKDSKKRLVKALFAYTPVNEDELHIKVNDILEVIEETEEGWWKGVLDGTTGMFPSNFVIELDKVPYDNVLENNLSPTKTPSKVISLTQSESSNSYANNISPQVKQEPKSRGSQSNVPDLIDGSCVSKSSSLEKKPTHSRKTPDSVAPRLPPKPVKELAKALYPYEMKNEDELSLKEGDIITIISKEVEDKGWWKGELNNRIGVFPDNFVKLIKSEEQKKPERPDKPPSVLSSKGSLKNVTPDKNAPELSPKVDKKPVKTPPAKPPPPEIHRKVSDPERPLPPCPSKKPTPPNPVKKPSRLAGGVKLPITNASAITRNSPTAEGQSLVAALTSSFERAEESAKGDVEKESQKSNKELAFDAIEPSSKKLVHLTANRAKLPNRRPPSFIFLKDADREAERNMSTDSRRLSEPLLAEIETLLPLAESEKINSMSSAELKPKVPPARPAFPMKSNIVIKPDPSILRRSTSQIDENATKSQTDLQKIETPTKKLVEKSYIKNAQPSLFSDTFASTNSKNAVSSVDTGSPFLRTNPSDHKPDTSSNISPRASLGVSVANTAAAFNMESRKLPPSPLKSSVMPSSSEVMPDLTLSAKSEVYGENDEDKAVVRNDYNALLKQLSELQENFEQFRRKTTKDILDLKEELKEEKKKRHNIEMELQKLKG